MSVRIKELDNKISQEQFYEEYLSCEYIDIVDTMSEVIECINSLH